AHGMTRYTFVSGEGDTVGPYPGEYYRTPHLSPSSFNNSWFLLMLRLMLVAEIEGEDGLVEKLHLAYSTPRAWLEKGKPIRVERADTVFGDISYAIDSEIENGKINMIATLTDRVGAAKAVTIRLRTPGKRIIKRVKINRTTHESFDPDEEIND